MFHGEYDEFLDAVRKRDIDYILRYLANKNIPTHISKQAFTINMKTNDPGMFIILLANGVEFPRQIPLRLLRIMFPNCHTKERIINFLSRLYGYPIEVTPELDAHFQHIANLLAPRRCPVAPQALFTGRPRRYSQPEKPTGAEKAELYSNRPRALSH